MAPDMELEISKAGEEGGLFSVLNWDVGFGGGLGFRGFWVFRV